MYISYTEKFILPLLIKFQRCSLINTQELGESDHDRLFVSLSRT